MKLRLEGVRHAYPVPGEPEGQGRPVLDVDGWELPAGAEILVHGVSGSGKTTLLNLLAGLLPPNAGEVWLDGQALYALPGAARDRLRCEHIGYVFQAHYLLPALSALENVVMPMAFAGCLRGEARRRRARELLAQVGLADFERYRPAQLSAGQRLRVAVARALANAPRLLLADEPTAALDEEQAAVVIDLLRTTCRPRAATLIVASHDPALDKLFERTVWLRTGTLCEESVRC